MALRSLRLRRRGVAMEHALAVAVVAVAVVGPRAPGRVAAEAVPAGCCCRCSPNAVQNGLVCLQTIFSWPAVLSFPANLRANQSREWGPPWFRKGGQWPLHFSVA